MRNARQSQIGNFNCIFWFNASNTQLWYWLRNWQKLTHLTLPSPGKPAAKCSSLPYSYAPCPRQYISIPHHGQHRAATHKPPTLRWTTLPAKLLLVVEVNFKLDILRPSSCPSSPIQHSPKWPLVKNQHRTTTKMCTAAPTPIYI